jgi:hypothetical protein
MIPLRRSLLLAPCLAVLSALAVLNAGCLASEDDPGVDDVPTVSSSSALLSPQVAGLSSSGVFDAMASVDTNLTTSTPVDSAVGNCPLYNNGPFVKLNAGYCVGPSSTYFYGWEMVTLRVDNSGDVDSVDLRFTHDRTGSAATPAPQTLVYTSWDGQHFAYAGAFTASTTATTQTVRVVPPTRPAPRVWIVLGKSISSAPAPAGPTLRWFEVSAQSNYVVAPAGLTAQVVSSSAVDLRWTDTSTGERDFEIYLQDAGGWRSLGADPGGANQTSERITGLAGNTTYSFKVRARSAASTSPFSNVAVVTTPAGPPGQIDVVNSSQVDLLAFAIDGVARTPTQVVGNRASFSAAAGTHDLGVAIGFGPSAGIASGARICDWVGTVAVASGLTSTVTIAPLTAGQVLTHCGSSIDYEQGSYVDLNGFHTVEMRFHANGAYDWWHDGVLQAGGTITRTTFTPPTLAFTLSSGDQLSLGWPYGSLFLNVNGFSVQLLRATGW